MCVCVCLNFKLLNKSPIYPLCVARGGGGGAPPPPPQLKDSEYTMYWAIHLHTCIHVHTYVYTYTHIYIRTYIHTYIHVHTYIQYMYYITCHCAGEVVLLGVSESDSRVGAFESTLSGLAVLAGWGTYVHVFIPKLYLIRVELAHIYMYKNLNNFRQEWDMGTGLVPFYSTRWSG